MNLMDDYIDIKIDIFEHTGQRARVRRSITVAMLIDEILKEFDDIAADTPSRYTLSLKGSEQPLALNATLEKLDIQPHDELVFDYARQALRQMLPPQNYAILREETTGKIFDIQWQPSVIGRPSTDMDHNLTLAVNMQLIPNGQTVSRRHAQITFSKGRYFIEALSEYNPVYLGGKEIPVNTPREIKHGDRLAIGRKQISFTFFIRPATTQETPGRPSAVRATTPEGGVVSHPAEVVQAGSQVPGQPAQPWEVSPPPGSDATQVIIEGSENAALIIERSSSPENIGQRLELLAFPFLLGRNIPALATEGEVSRRHAEINYDPLQNQYTVTDLNSTNGVRIDGEVISPNKPYPLRPGSRLGLGQKVVLRLDA